jgi:hypothetical protein
VTCCSASTNFFFVMTGDYQHFVIPTHNDWYGGSKAIADTLLIGAFNYFHLDEFVKYIKALPWTYPEKVQLLVRGEDDDQFHSVELF